MMDMPMIVGYINNLMQSTYSAILKLNESSSLNIDVGLTVKHMLGLFLKFGVYNFNYQKEWQNLNSVGISHFYGVSWHFYIMHMYLCIFSPTGMKYSVHCSAFQ